MVVATLGMNRTAVTKVGGDPFRIDIADSPFEA
jgi:hypothetical protein